MEKLEASVSVDAFKAGMSKLPGSVNIVTTDGPGGRAGLTASAVCSVTADPPTLLVCVNKGSSVGAIFEQNQAICVNTLHPDQVDLAIEFGKSKLGQDRFGLAQWAEGRSGAPVLLDCSVSFDCTVVQRFEVGTHQILICRILDVIISPSASGVVYFDRRFHVLS